MNGERLKQLRKERKLTQEQLGNKINVTKVSISGYENGNRSPDTDTLEKLADFFGVTTDYLLGRDDNLEQDKATKRKEKDERDIAKRLEQFKEEIENSDGLAFNGEPISEEAKESLIDAMEHIFRQTQRINKKYIPKKYRDDE